MSNISPPPSMPSVLAAGPARFEGVPRIWLLFLLLAACAPWVLYPIFLMKLLCFALFACAFNLLLGYTGLLSFGHAAFFGGAAYITAHAAKVWNFPPEVAVLVGTAFAALLGVVIGALAIRRQGIYFAMTTLALAQMISFLALQLPFTGGEDGIQAVPRGMLLGVFDLEKPLVLYYVVLAVFVFGFFAVWRVVNSPFGHVLKAIRENEPRAVSLGYHTVRYKLVVFVLSAALAGLAGSVKIIVFQLASLTDITWHMSGTVVLMVLLGGVGTLAGPIVGASIIIGMEHFLAGTSFPVDVANGLLFMVCVLAFRRGIVGELAPWFQRLRRRNPGSDTSGATHG